MPRKTDATQVNGQNLTRVDPRQLIAYRILSLSALLNRGIEALLDTQAGLSVRQWRVLLCLANNGAQSVQRIADFWRYDKSQVSRAVSELAARKLVRGKPSPEDGRSIVVSITAAGRRLYEQALPLSLTRQHELTQCLTDSQLEEFEKTVDLLTEQAEDMLRAAYTQRDDARRDDARRDS